MPESAQEWYARVRARIDDDGYRAPAWSEWPTWPFDGELQQRELEPHGDEPPRGGAGGSDCFMCMAEATTVADKLATNTILSKDSSPPKTSFRPAN
ncbi:MAG: hypothetical protein WKF50_07235 [Nocardioides sp.]